MRLRGFTYIEVILTMALMMFIGIMASPFYGNFVYSQDSDIASKELRGSLVKARLYSMVGKGNDTWGVTLEGNKIILFKGSSFGARQSEFDEEYMVNEKVNISGMNEIVFSRITGTPSTQPTITVSYYTNSSAPETHTHTLTLNDLGVVEESY